MSLHNNLYVYKQAETEITILIVYNNCILYICAVCTKETQLLALDNTLYTHLPLAYLL